MYIKIFKKFTLLQQFLRFLWEKDYLGKEKKNIAGKFIKGGNSVFEPQVSSNLIFVLTLFPAALGHI